MVAQNVAGHLEQPETKVRFVGCDRSSPPGDQQHLGDQVMRVVLADTAEEVVEQQRRVRVVDRSVPAVLPVRGSMSWLHHGPAMRLHDIVQPIRVRSGADSYTTCNIRYTYCNIRRDGIGMGDAHRRCGGLGGPCRRGTAPAVGRVACESAGSTRIKSVAQRGSRGIGRGIRRRWPRPQLPCRPGCPRSSQGR